jgi:hypothetical protein
MALQLKAMRGRRIAMVGAPRRSFKLLEVE